MAKTKKKPEQTDEARAERREKNRAKRTRQMRSSPEYAKLLARAKNAETARDAASSIAKSAQTKVGKLEATIRELREELKQARAGVAA